MLHHRRTDEQKSLQKKSKFWPGDVASRRDQQQDDSKFKRNQKFGGHGEIQELWRQETG